MPLSTSTISIIDLIGFSQQIAQLNLGYLGISVAILGVLGGVFVYFNIKPLKDSLDKQEKSLEELRKEARNLLNLSGEQLQNGLESFKFSQDESVSAILKQQEEKLDLETTNKIQKTEKLLVEKIGSVSEEKDVKLKEIVFSEVTNRSSLLEKSLTSQITTTKEAINKELAEAKQKLISLEARLKESDEMIKELQVYKFSKEGQMGAIIYSIELFRDAVADFLKTMESLSEPNKDLLEETMSWKVKTRLEGLIREIGDLNLEEKYKKQINEQLEKIQKVSSLGNLIIQLNSKLV